MYRADGFPFLHDIHYCRHAAWEVHKNLERENLPAEKFFCLCLCSCDKCRLFALHLHLFKLFCEVGAALWNDVEIRLEIAVQHANLPALCCPPVQAYHGL